MQSFSIILPTYNAGLQLSKLLKQLSMQEGIVKEVIVIDSSSNDTTVEIAKNNNTKIISISKESFDHGGTRNLAAKQATGDILMFITQDIIPKDVQLLSAFEKTFADKSIGGAYARQIPRVGANPVEALTRVYSYPENSRINTYDDFLKNGVTSLYFANPCACVRKTVFQEVGGFPDTVICNEDMVIAHKILKAGYKTAYVSDAIVHHSHDYSAMQLFKRFFDIGCFFESYPELKTKANNSKEGFSQTTKSIKYLLKNNIVWLPKYIIETIAKLAGYKTGQKYKLLPRFIKKRISMNKNFWK